MGEMGGRWGREPEGGRASLLAAPRCASLACARVWRRPGSSALHLRLLAQVDREGESFFIAVAIGDTPWPAPPCSSQYVSTCAEDAAASLAGRIGSVILEADSALGLASAAELQAAATLALPPLGTFYAHVHTLEAQARYNGTVVADGLQPSFVGLSTSEWLAQVRLSENVLAGVGAAGHWAGPLAMSPEGFDASAVESTDVTVSLSERRVT